MDLIGYTMELESLTNRYTILIVIQLVIIVLLLVFVWALPYLEKKMTMKSGKHKNKRKARLSKETKRNALAVQIVAAAFLVVTGTFFISDDVKTLNALKEDVNQNSFAIYEGDAELIYSSFNSFFDLFVDPRIVTFKNSDERYWIDMSKMYEGVLTDAGEFHGKIVYGENSKFILKIE